jgi:hypothetical protein
MKLTTHLHLVPRLRICGYILPLPQYVFMAWYFVQHRDNFNFTFISIQSRDSSVGLELGYGMDDRGSRIRFQAGTGNFSLHHRVQNDSGAHPASYPMDTRVPFPGGKAGGA